MSDYRKLEQFTVLHRLQDADVLDKNIVKNTVKVLKEIYPFNLFLTEAIGRQIHKLMIDKKAI